MTIEIETPSGWAICTIDSVVALDGIFTDGDWVESKDQDPNGDVRLIQLADIGDGEFLNKSARFLTKSKAYDLNCTFLREGDLLVARMPDPLGRCCIFPLAGDEKYVTVVDVCAIRLGSSPINHKYMMYLVNSPAIRGAIAALQSGSTRKRISRKNLTTIALPLAPINEQHRIVAKIEELFSELDKGIESLKTAREQLKVYRQAVLKHAFEGKLTAQWREENKDDVQGSTSAVSAGRAGAAKLETADQLLARIQKERESRNQQQLDEWKASIKAWEENGKLGKKPAKPKKILPLEPIAKEELDVLPAMPSGWCYIRLGLIIDEPKYGTSKKCVYEYDGLGVLRIPNVVSGVIDARDLKFADFDSGEIETYNLKQGDILTIRSNGSISIVGKCALISEHEEKYLYAGYLIRLRPNDCLVSSRYLLAVLSSHLLRSQIEAKAKSTSGVNNINSGELQSLIVPVCAMKEQSFVVAYISAVLSSIDNLEEEIASNLKKSEALRQSILKKAFSGQLVEQDPDDEPASVLLERIKAEKAQHQLKPRKKAVKRKAATGVPANNNCKIRSNVC
jgi:type I restriction enzyme S subunit